MNVSASHKKESAQTKNGADGKESETEKEEKGKEKIEEQEKFYTRSNHLVTTRFELPSKDKFTCFNTRLNRHPYQEDDIQPPRPL